MTDSFWTKVLWSRFIKHFRKLTDEQIIKDIHESMDALEDNDASGDSFGAKMVAWANERRNEKAAVASRENGNLGGRPKKNPQDAPNGNAGVDGKSATSFDHFTADVDTREESIDEKSGTSANNCGDAARREAAEGESNGNVASDRTTVSNTFALDMPGPDKGEQSAKTRDSRGSGRYQPPSLGPEDGNLYDQEPIEVSTKPTGGHILRSSSRSPVGDVLSLAYSGEFGNVRLTQEQYAELGIRFGNQQKLNRAIDSLSCKIENEEIKPRNHYAELVKWASYREDMDERKEEEASKPKMTEMEKSWIAAMKRVEAM